VADSTTYNLDISLLLPIDRVRAVDQSSPRAIGNTRALGNKGAHDPMSGKSRLYVCALLSAIVAVVSTTALGQAASSQPASNSAPTASAPPPSGPAKVAIVRIQDAIAASDEGKKELDGLEARFAPKRNELKALNDEVEGLKKDLQAKGDKLNEEERAKQLKTLEAKQKTLQRDYEDAQNEFQQGEQEIINRIGQKMLNVLEKYGNDNGYTVILDVSNPQTPVLWARPGTEITKQLVDAYNSQYPVTPAAAAPKPAGAAANRTPGSGTAAPKKP
jgi:outer membrane protein